MKKTLLLTSLIAAALTLASCGDAGSSTDSTKISSTGGITSISQGGTTMKAKGPTEAPDLVSVGGLREGPTTDQGEPTTLVDFEFDQRAYLNGGDRTNLHLARTDGGDALDAAGTVPEDD